MSSTQSAPHETGPRTIPGAIGISLLMSAVCAAMSFFVALFVAIIVFFIVAWSRGGAQTVDFTATYRWIAMPVGFAGLIAGFVVTLVLSLRRRAG